MYCPQCGHQQTVAEMRFCSYCGLKLGLVKACLTDDDGAPAAPEPHATPTLPRQRNINLGVLLMFLGTLVTSWVAGKGGPRLIGREGAALLLATIFIALLLCSGPLLRALYKLLSWDAPPADDFAAPRREMNLGVLLMFLSTILSAFAAILLSGRMGTPAFLAVLLTLCASLLLSSRHLLRALQQLFITADGRPAHSPHAPNAPALILPAGTAAAGAALPPAQGMPVTLFSAQHATTSEMVAPPTITENTTNLLEDR